MSFLPTKERIAFYAFNLKYIPGPFVRHIGISTTERECAEIRIVLPLPEPSSITPYAAS